MPKILLNLGCGANPITLSGYQVINHDLTAHSPWVDEIWDLNRLPWRWADESIDHLISNAVFEHLDIDLLASMNQAWRILAQDGILDIRVPYYLHANAYKDPTHRWRYTLDSLDFFVPDTLYGQQMTFRTPYKWAYVNRPHLNRIKSAVLARLRKIPSKVPSPQESPHDRP